MGLRKLQRRHHLVADRHAACASRQSYLHVGMYLVLEPSCLLPSRVLLADNVAGILSVFVRDHDVMKKKTFDISCCDTRGDQCTITPNSFPKHGFVEHGVFVPEGRE